MIGVKSGETSFDVDELRARQRDEKRRRILPEDGEWVEEDASDPGTRFGPQWREEELCRRKILEADPNYQFLELVAGAVNDRVERLYDEDSVGEALRRRLKEQQARLAGQEATVELDKLQASLARLQEQQPATVRMQGEVAERQNTGFLSTAKLHHTALVEYVSAVSARRTHVDLTNLLECATDPMCVSSTLGELALRVIGAEFSDDESAGIGVPPTVLGALMMWDERAHRPRVVNLLDAIEKDARERAEELGADVLARHVRGGDVRRILRGLHNFGWRTGEERFADAPDALVVALRRLIVLKHASIEDRDAAVQNFLQVRSAATRASLPRDQQNVLALDGEITDGVLTEFRKTSMEAWLGEADALVMMLETALTLLEEQSPLTSPTEEVGPALTREEVALARGAAAEERQRRRRERAARPPAPEGEEEDLFGDLDVGAPPPRRQGVLGEEVEEETARALRERILRDVPNRRIMALDDAVIGEYKQRVAVVRMRVSEAKEYAQNVGAQPGVVLRRARVVGGPDLAKDTAFKNSTPRIGVGPPPNTPEELWIWADAMAWYEALGGDLFERLGVKFPVGRKVREQARGGADIPTWSAEVGTAPPRYSTRMKLLWDRHTPTLASASVKVATAVQRAATAGVPPLPRRVELVSQEKLRKVEEARRLLADVPMPKLTASERIVYRTLKGVMPEKVAIETRDRDRMIVDDSLLIVSARLYEAELAIAAETLRKAVAQRNDLMHTTRERIDKMLRGEPVVRAVPQIPYDHRRGWVEQPEHSGVVRMVPIVTQGIAAAWNRLRRLAPNITDAVDIEFAQHDPQMRPDFADLVAVEMAFIAQRFPKQYIQLGQRAHTATDLASVVQRFRANYNLNRTRQGPVPRRPQPTPARGAAYVASVVPTGRRGSMLLI
jgi:hypothetical protein